ncbi:MAG: sensor histidine kinase [Candidatus Omnitrophota bacterium]
MKKIAVILGMVVEIGLLFLFQNIHFLFQEIERRNVGAIRDPLRFLDDIRRMGKVFSTLTVVTGLIFIGSGLYLVYLYRKNNAKSEDQQEIPPLHGYLLQLKDSENQLKNLVKQQTEHVLEKEELNRSIISNINAAVIFLNQAGRIEIFNAVAEQLFGQSYANARNNRPDIILAAFPEIVQFIEANQGKKISGEVIAKEQIFNVDLIPIEHVGRVLLIKDITEERKREEIQCRNSNFVMLGEMAAFLAHEVRNSLGVIYGYTRTIETDKEKTGKITKEIHFLTAMMENFLSFSKPVKVSGKEEIDLVDLLKKVAGENGVEMSLNREQMVVESDVTLMRSVFSNLILNSVQAGASTIQVEFNTVKDQWLDILLKDNGKGIDPQTVEKIWYPFFTTKDKGTGMGLAIIRKILNTLNGEISLKESSPQGTTFEVIFYN